MDASDTEPNASGDDFKLIRILCGVDVAMMTGNLIFAAYIVFRLLIPM